MATATRQGTRDRHERLLALVRSGKTHVHDLSAALGVSTSTVRRDLGRLSEAGALNRVYGGVATGGTFRERALTERMSVETEAKAAIGLRAADLVPQGGTIFLDAGSTCAQLAEHLRGRSGLTVLTRGLEIALLLASEPGLEVVVVGGRVAMKSHGLVGSLTDLTLDRFMVDVAFLGVDALDPVDGVGEPTLTEAHVKEVAARRGRKVVVLADATKLHRGAVPAWAPLPENWTLVTNELDEEVLDRYRSHGVDVISA
ncbi:MAG TPA: DeoR/GlpR family DNA-binding transcription regulator [Coriobacteriia bacterium]|nr:DeoR/GlpR family DNA-binding transcription regulator [Coriobacteriia bacterium]